MLAPLRWLQQVYWHAPLPAPGSSTKEGEQGVEWRAHLRAAKLAGRPGRGHANALHVHLLRVVGVVGRGARSVQRQWPVALAELDACREHVAHPPCSALWG